MTNKQAQITINAIKFMLDHAQYSDDVEEALNMAINALTAQEEERTETHGVCLDVISRADVEQTVEDNILCYTHSDRPIDQDPDTECHKAIRTALRMLRKDLRKLPSVQPASYRQVTGKLDCISRQDALDALEKVAELFPWKVPGNRDSYDSYNEAWNDAIGRAEIEIEKLQPAQPPARCIAEIKIDKDDLEELIAKSMTNIAQSDLQSTCNKLATDCISRQAAIDAMTNTLRHYPSECYRNLNKYEFAKGLAELGLKSVPPAQPERLSDDDFETIRIHLNACKEKLCNQHRWEEAEEYQRIIDRFMAFASTQPEQPEIIHCRDCKYHIDGFFCQVANHHTSDKDCCASVFGAERRKG